MYVIPRNYWRKDDKFELFCHYWALFMTIESSHQHFFHLLITENDHWEAVKSRINTFSTTKSGLEKLLTAFRPVRVNDEGSKIDRNEGWYNFGTHSDKRQKIQQKNLIVQAFIKPSWKKFLKICGDDFESLLPLSFIASFIDYFCSCYCFIIKLILFMYVPSYYLFIFLLILFYFCLIFFLSL